MTPTWTQTLCRFTQTQRRGSLYGRVDVDIGYATPDSRRTFTGQSPWTVAMVNVAAFFGVGVSATESSQVLRSTTT